MITHGMPSLACRCTQYLCTGEVAALLESLNPNSKVLPVANASWQHKPYQATSPLLDKSKQQRDQAHGVHAEQEPDTGMYLLQPMHIVVGHQPQVIIER